MAKYSFFFDQSRCYGCKTCSIACKNWNSLEPGPVKWLRIVEWETGTFPNPRLHTLFLPCFHCEIPLCLEACPDNAIYKDDKYGAILVDEKKCQSSPCKRECYDQCPYGAPQFASEALNAKMTKCTMCIDRLEAGELPVCVHSCPVRALDFGPTEVIEAKYGKLKDLTMLPDSSQTNPSIVFKPERQHKNLVPLDTARVIELFANRENLPPLYQSSKEVETYPGLVGRETPIIKPQSIEQLMRATQNDEG